MVTKAKLWFRDKIEVFLNENFLFIFTIMFIFPVIFISTSWNVDSYDGPYPLLINKDALQNFTLIGLYCITFLVLQITFALSDYFFEEKVKKWFGEKRVRDMQLFLLYLFSCIFTTKPNAKFFYLLLLFL